jgi:hypothetical protein
MQAPFMPGGCGSNAWTSDDVHALLNYVKAIIGCVFVIAIKLLLPTKGKDE